MTLMDGLTIIVAIVSGSVSAGGAIWGMRVKIQQMQQTSQRDIQLVQTEIRECRRRIDNLLTLLVNHDATHTHNGGD